MCQWSECTPISCEIVSNDFCDLCKYLTRHRAELDPRTKRLASGGRPEAQRAEQLAGREEGEGAARAGAEVPGEPLEPPV